MAVAVIGRREWLGGLAATLCCAGRENPEIRGVWMARDSLGSRDAIARSMAELQEANFNLVYALVWSQGYPLWRSEAFEQHAGLATDPVYGQRDVLREVIEEASARGLAVMPWFEYGFVSGYTGRGAPGSRGPILDAHPEWIAQRRNGSVDFSWAGDTRSFWMSHTHPDVHAFLFDLIDELLLNYDVPGVQFDRARYPELDCGYDEATRVAYAADHEGKAPPNNPSDAAWMRWRSDKLNDFVAALRARVRSTNWRALMTNAPIVYPFSYVNFLQSYPEWVSRGLLDFVSPQIYRSDFAGFTAELDRQLVHVENRARFVPGIDVTNTDAEMLIRQIEAVRARSLPGVVVWYHQGLVRKNALSRLRETVFPGPVPLPWK